MFRNIDASNRLMIWRRKMIEKGFSEDEYKQFEQDVFNGYIAEDIAKNLSETKNVLNEIKKSNKIGLIYFIIGSIIGIGGLLIGMLL